MIRDLGFVAFLPPHPSSTLSSSPAAAATKSIERFRRRPSGSGVPIPSCGSRFWSPVSLDPLDPIFSARSHFRCSIRSGVLVSFARFFLFSLLVSDGELLWRSDRSAVAMGANPCRFSTMPHFPSGSRVKCTVLAVLCGKVGKQRAPPCPVPGSQRQRPSYPFPELISSGRLEVSISFCCLIFLGASLIAGYNPTSINLCGGEITWRIRSVSSYVKVSYTHALRAGADPMHSYWCQMTPMIFANYTTKYAWN